MLFFLKRKPDPIVAKMVTKIPRSLGQGWQELTLRQDAHGNYSKEFAPSAAPADNTPIMVMGGGMLADDHMSWLLEGARKTQDYWSRKQRKPSEKEIHAAVNRLWMDFCEQKLKHFKGQSQFGPGGHTQRQVPGRTRWNGAEK